MSIYLLKLDLELEKKLLENSGYWNIATVYTFAMTIEKIEAPEATYQNEKNVQK